MKKYSIDKELPGNNRDNKNGLDYTLHGDYYFPDVLLRKEHESIPLGRWGREYMRYLENSRPGLYTRMVLSGKLYLVVYDLDHQAQERFDLIVSQLIKAEGITESLKTHYQMEWVRRMNGIRNQAEEIVWNEMIYC